eukprot:gene11290-39418_t
MLHGLGATHDQFLPLCDALSSLAPLAGERGWGVVGRVQAAFTPGGQWWDVDMVKLAMEMRKGEKGMARLLRDRPRGMRHSCGGVVMMSGSAMVVEEWYGGGT